MVLAQKEQQIEEQTKTLDPDAIKNCCANFYENDLLARVLGESFHPGGEKLTIHLGDRLDLNKNSSVLDIACGSGESALSLAKYYECKIVGIDLSEKNLEKAREKAEAAGFSDKIYFIKSDAELLDFIDEKFDAVICECALCTFPDKETALNEMFRVVKKGGKVGITDVTIAGDLPDGLQNMMFHVACIAGAIHAKEYQDLLCTAGFCQVKFEDHSYTLQEVLDRVDKLVKGWELITKICACDLQEMFGITLTPEKIKKLLEMATNEIESGNIGYGLFIGCRD